MWVLPFHLGRVPLAVVLKEAIEALGESLPRGRALLRDCKDAVSLSAQRRAQQLLADRAASESGLQLLALEVKDVADSASKPSTAPLAG